MNYYTYTSLILCIGIWIMNLKNLWWKVLNNIYRRTSKSDRLGYDCGKKCSTESYQRGNQRETNDMAKIVQEFHICAEFNGHEPSTDCWCEPVEVNTKTIDGVVFRMVQHVDTASTKLHRKKVVAMRSNSMDYVTRLLNSIK